MKELDKLTDDIRKYCELRGIKIIRGKIDRKHISEITNFLSRNKKQNIKKYYKKKRSTIASTESININKLIGKSLTG